MRVLIEAQFREGRGLDQILDRMNVYVLVEALGSERVEDRPDSCIWHDSHNDKYYSPLPNMVY